MDNIQNTRISNILDRISMHGLFYVIWLSVNFTVCFFLLGGSGGSFIALILTYAVSICFALSHAGEKLLRIVESIRPVLTKREREYLEPIFAEVYNSVKALHPNIGHVELHLQDIMSVNALAIGNHTVALTKGAVETFSEEELKGVLAHELGHIANGDTVAILLNTIGNGIFSLLVCLYRLYILLADIITGMFDNTGFLKVIFKLVRFFVDMSILSMTFIGRAVLSIDDRKNEYRADKFAFDVGYGTGLTEALYLLQRMSLSEKMTIKERLHATHPILALRINRLETAMDEVA